MGLRIPSVQRSCLGDNPRSIFIDQAIYDEEMAKSFGRTWLMIGYESLVLQVNNFFHIYMIEDPMILNRDNQERLHAFLNMCQLDISFACSARWPGAPGLHS